MSEFKYVKELLRSFGEVFRKPVLLLPFVYIFILSTIFLFITPISYFSIDGTIDFNALLTMIVLGLIQGLIALAFLAMGLTGLRDYVSGRDVTCKTQFKGGLKMYWKVLLVRIYQLLIVVVPLAILFLIYAGVLAISEPVASVVGAILMILAIIYLVLAAFFFLFSTVIVTYEGKSANSAVKDSYYFSKQNSMHTFLAIITLLVASLILLLLILILYVPFLFSTSITMMYMQSILMALISIPLSAAFLLYLFKAFNGGQGPRKFTARENAAIKAEKVEAKSVKKSAKKKAAKK